MIGFSVGVNPNAKNVLSDSGVELISHDVIYHITEKIEKIISGMLDPKEVEIELGRAKTLQIFYTDKKFMIIGLSLQDEAVIEKKASVRVIRKDKIAGTGVVDSLKQ